MDRVRGEEPRGDAPPPPPGAVVAQNARWEPSVESLRVHSPQLAAGSLIRARNGRWPRPNAGPRLDPRTDRGIEEVAAVTRPEKRRGNSRFSLREVGTPGRSAEVCSIARRPLRPGDATATLASAAARGRGFHPRKSDKAL
ncbi:hypothetical protein BN873_p70034 [Candidatus Competibacter denitrificans Run_A_D11]|uniref:Uncharacterized protein n=1 Tax=Candidatus Competibacter denitrificans Run_A_D11 TaxID=1400863 RepID=W6M9V7_9GAMM|nr:hypothetical protein BN873_p70034 [Candidatus Competibacter denitrificans Run_A_D11]